VGDGRRQLDDLALGELGSEAGEEVVGDIHWRGAHAVGVLEGQTLPSRKRKLVHRASAERRVDLLTRQAPLAADGGVDIHSEGTAVESGHPHAYQLA
jgi:hypothetical protein